jgi:hypothetical protein
VSWGRFASKTEPTIGNHEIQGVSEFGESCLPKGSGYYTYFKNHGVPEAQGVNGKGYYSYDVGSWHFISLNANCTNAGGNTDPLQPSCLDQVLIKNFTGSILAGGTDNPADNTDIMLVTSDDVDRGKPDPAAYLEAARQFAVSADRSVVFEDTSVGIAAGRAAGATVIGVTTTFPTLDGCDYSVRDLRAIRRVASDRPIRLVVDNK